MSESINELRHQVAVLEERMNTAKAENESAMERLRTDIARDAKERAQWDKYLMASVFGVGVAVVTVLSALDVIGDRHRHPAPVIINLPPGSQMPVVQGREVQVLPQPASPSQLSATAPGGEVGE